MGASHNRLQGLDTPAWLGSRWPLGAVAVRPTACMHLQSDAAVGPHPYCVATRFALQFWGLTVFSVKEWGWRADGARREELITDPSRYAARGSHALNVLWRPSIFSAVQELQGPTDGLVSCAAGQQEEA